MDEYIKRSAVVNWLKRVGRLLKSEHNHKEKTALVGKIIDHIENLPAADVYTEENVLNAYTEGYSTGMAQGMEKAVRHGRWVDHMVRDWRCSVCGEKIAKVRKVDGYCYEDKPHYCPNCGARMDGE